MSTPFTPEALFRHGTTTEVPEDMWKAPESHGNAIKRQAAAAELWMELTRPEGSVDSEHDDPEPEYADKEASFQKLSELGPEQMKGLTKFTSSKKKSLEGSKKILKAVREGGTKGSGHMTRLMGRLGAGSPFVRKVASRKEAGTTVGEIAARGKPPPEEESQVPNVTEQAMADGEQMAQQQAAMQEQAAASQPAEKPKKKTKKKEKKDEDKKPEAQTGGVTVNVHTGGSKSDDKKDDDKGPEKKAGLQEFLDEVSPSEDLYIAGTPREDGAVPVYVFNGLGGFFGEKKASKPAIGAGLGAAGAGTLAAGLQYLKSKKRPGGKSREELSREENVNKLKTTAANEGKQGRVSKLKQRYAEMQLEQAKKNKKNPGRAALLASLLPAAAGAVAGGATGKALS